MKLIIDIPNEMAHRFKNEGEQKYHDYHTVLKACVDAIPLEKHDAELLDKIRAEIEEQKESHRFDNDHMCIYKTGLNDAIDIIDKYRKEQTDEDSD